LIETEVKGRVEELLIEEASSLMEPTVKPAHWGYISQRNL
jgi:hypothetical protein